MNDRIRKLAIQAAGKGYQTFSTSDLDSQEKIEKFGELIVRECCDMFINMNYKHHVKVSAYEIKKHFGVEE